MNIKTISRAMTILITLALLISLFATTVPVGASETRDIVILGTSDLHGTVDNYDYFTDSVPSTSSGRGLTKIATYVNSVRNNFPNTILIDNGDTIQGNPLAYYFNMIDTSLENPLAVAMNSMKYVSATVGNHEFNYGPAVLSKFQKEAKFPLLSANVTGCRDYSFVPYTIQDVNGVQVGILGLTPAAVPHWEKPENIVDCIFGDAMAAANKYVPEMRAAGADIIVVAAHTGLDETYGYGREENFAKILANEVPGIDVILAGHAHANVAGQFVNNVLITEPNYHGRNISDIRIQVTGSGNEWTVSTKNSTTPAMSGPLEDPGLKALMQPYHDTTVTYINTPIGTATDAFPGGFAARVQDGPLADLINRVQMDAAAKAGFPVEASLAALFNDGAKLNPGPIKLKDAYAVYIYDNTLYVIEATGQMIKDELEWTAGYFNQYYYQPTGVTKVSSFADYNYDLWSGIEYKIDVTKPVGQRVVELKLSGQPLAMDQVVHLALNNYRATGKFPTAPKLYQSTTEVRELITNWIMERGTISPSDVYEQNYTLLPPVNTWLSTTTANPVSRSDYADLLWTAFDGVRDDYVKLPSEKKPGNELTREGGLYLLGNRAMDGMWDIAPDMSVLDAYTDQRDLSKWAKVSTAYAIQAWIFTPEGDQLMPKQAVTNAEALAWVREARFPYYTFLSTNDFHGQLEPKVLSSSNPVLVSGAAYDMTYINSYKARNPFGTLLFDAGDMMQGTPISNLLLGESVIDVFNHMGYQAAVVGNHEFDWGLTVMQDRITQAEFPVLLANVFNEGTDIRPDWMVPTAMFDVKGQQIGVIGVTSKDTPGIVMPGNTAGLEFRDAGPVVAAFTAELRAAGADIVVVLAHMPATQNSTTGVVSGEITSVALPGVDLIISGHAHANIAGKVNNIPVIQQYSSGTALGVSSLSYDRLNDTVINASLQVVTTYNQGVTPDAGIATIVQSYKDQIGPIVNAVKGSVTGPISRTANSSGESAMGNLLTDAQAWKGGTQIAFTNPGGIRAAIEFTSYPHDITWTDLFLVQPFDNKLVTMSLTGTQIYNLLEQQFVVNRILPVSGLKYTYNLGLPAGSRITSLTLSDGTPVNKDATPYTVTCNEYIGTGGDGFTVFLEGTNFTRIGVSDLDALVEYVVFKFGVPPGNTPIDPNVYPKIEGRIVKQ